MGARIPDNDFTTVDLLITNVTSDSSAVNNGQP
jgi:hypothetical protein